PRRLREGRRGHPGAPGTDHERRRRAGVGWPDDLQRATRALRHAAPGGRAEPRGVRGAVATARRMSASGARLQLRRSLLFVPATTPERTARAAASAADGVILDLEDAVAPAEKAQAREGVVAALRTVDFRGRERVVRVNALDGPHGGDDLAAVVSGAPD